MFKPYIELYLFYLKYKTDISAYLEAYKTLMEYKSRYDKLQDKLNISSNFNILIHSQKIERENKEDQMEYNLDDGDVAPVEYYIKNNNSNVKEEEIKTLTNDEDIYIESRTDQLLYKPYSEDEINK